MSYRCILNYGAFSTSIDTREIMQYLNVPKPRLVTFNNDGKFGGVKEVSYGVLHFQFKEYLNAHTLSYEWVG